MRSPAVEYVKRLTAEFVSTRALLRRFHVEESKPILSSVSWHVRFRHCPNLIFGFEARSENVFQLAITYTLMSSFLRRPALREWVQEFKGFNTMRCWRSASALLVEHLFCRMSKDRAVRRWPRRLRVLPRTRVSLFAIAPILSSAIYSI